MSDQPKRINPYKMFIGAMIPNWLMERKEVSPGAKLCYARLCQFSGKDGRCFPKQKTLADGLAVGARQVRNYIEELVKHGLIQSHRRGLNKSNYYTFHDHPWMHESEQSGEVDPVGEDADCLSERLEVASPIRESSKENQLNIPAAPDDSSLKPASGGSTRSRNASIPTTSGSMVGTARPSTTSSRRVGETLI
jgi:DNA-binding transcriptional MocR family regulator